MKKMMIALMMFSAGMSYAQKTTVISQPQYEVVYEFTKVNASEEKEVYHTLLQIGSTCAKFSDYATYQLDSVSQIATVSSDTLEKYRRQEVMEERYFEPQVYQNYPSGKLTYHDILIPNYYGYEEKLPCMEWILSEDTAEVCGYTCQKATTEYGGRKWKVWFATEIPVSYGPWKFFGLPGLVLKAENDEANLHFVATAIRKGNVALVMTPNPKRLKIKRERFIQDKNRFERSNNAMNEIPMETISSIRVEKDADRTVMFFNDVPFRNFQARTNTSVSDLPGGKKAITISKTDQAGDDDVTFDYVPLELE